MNKKLYRSNKNKIFFGVAGGLGEYFDVDPVFVRIAFVLLAFFNGVGFIGYLICAIIIPKEPLVFFNSNTEEPIILDEIIAEAEKKKKTHNKSVLGYFLIIIGGLFLLNNLIPSFGWEQIFPLIMITIGVWLIMNKNN